MDIFNTETTERMGISALVIISQNEKKITLLNRSLHSVGLLMMLALMMIHVKSQSQSPIQNIGYNIEMYYGIDFKNNEIQSDHYFNHHSLQAPRINYAQLEWKKSFNQWQFQLGIHDGDYVRRNYSDQPQWAQLISVAQLQYSPQNVKQLKLTAGIFPSHIGFESAWVQNNLTLTRSLLAENSPYYESGIHTQYLSKNGKLTLGILALTGWQQAHLATPVRKASWGWSSSFQLNTQILLSYNGFWGYQNATGIQPKSYHNFYSAIQKDAWKCIVGFDYGQIKNQPNAQNWYSPVVILSRTLNEQWQATFRIESMKDEYSMILIDNKNLITQKSTLGLTAQYTSKRKFQYRLECKQMFSEKSNIGKENNTLILFSFSKSGMLR